MNKELRLKTFRVYVTDNRTLMHLVEAESAEEAQRKVEASEDACEEFGYSVRDGQWSVDDVQET